MWFLCHGFPHFNSINCESNVPYFFFLNFVFLAYFCPALMFMELSFRSLLVAACEKRSFLMFDALSQKQVHAVENAHRDCVNCVR